MQTPEIQQRSFIKAAKQRKNKSCFWIQFATSLTFNPFMTNEKKGKSVSILGNFA